MSQFFVLPPAGMIFESQASPTFALAALLPVVSMPDQYPALPNWVYELCDRLGPEARRDYGLVTVLYFRAYSLFATDEPQMESAESYLAALSDVSEAEFQERVLRGLVSLEGDRSPENRDEPAIRRLLQGVSLPVGNESISLDEERATALLMNPAVLKRFIVSNLRRLWHEHLQPHWEKVAPAARQQALLARRHFVLGSAPKVFRAVTGRPFPQAMLAEMGRIKRIIFSPIPFYGPYCVCSFDPQTGELRAGYGVGIQPAVPEAPVGGESTLPGGLLPVLEALADETRLQILSIIRDRGQGSAQDFINELGLSQPATSRHLRLLETTGLLLVERVEGIKWYRLNPVRVGHVTSLINAFLTPGPQHSR